MLSCDIDALANWFVRVISAQVAVLFLLVFASV